MASWGRRKQESVGEEIGTDAAADCDREMDGRWSDKGVRKWGGGGAKGEESVEE
jgi:hypothetical protein